MDRFKEMPPANGSTPRCNRMEAKQAENHTSLTERVENLLKTLNTQHKYSFS